MDYLSSGFCCVGFSSSSYNDTFKITQTKKLLEIETGKEVEGFYSISTSTLKEGYTYKLIPVWSITKDGNTLKEFYSEEECKKAFNELIEILKKNNNVTEI